MRLLGVYAHPDDESFGAAALLARLARRGARLHGLFMTRGERGETHLDPPPTPDRLARLREDDLRQAAALIGFADLTLLDYRDGTLDRLPEGALVGEIERAIERLRPDVLLTFGPAGITGHADHRAVHRAALAAVGRTRAAGLGPNGLYYEAVAPELASQERLPVDGQPDGQPNLRLDVAETAEVRLEALRRHADHMADARAMVARLERQPDRVATLHRVFPEDADPLLRFLGSAALAA